ncbi:hypothetical protein [Mesotoga sp. H07.pep.5.3]|uniref:hypothetical protein n=1 Tax=Mesotoga sp. H07.pep.5.3 TaxID=1421003 RepID=UPI000C19FC6C|nr:hypothetical protein [Mesotoga sp. H07.pep.5.3]PIJ63264.1 hypothetical protein V513_01125 [Mesotoga sp. H07.pep.5.3]
MSLKDLLNSGPKVINLGMERFYLDLLAQKIPAVKVNWRPPLARSSLMDRLRKLRGEEVE